MIELDRLHYSDSRFIEDEYSFSELDLTGKYEQLVLPFEVRPVRLARWLQVVRERRRLFGRAATYTFVTKPSGLPKTTTIDAEKIGELKDPQLRYALRFADAANAAGWQVESPGAMSGHFVNVEATDEGLDSRFVHATYTGIIKDGVDTFMENLRRFDPHKEAD